MTRAALTALTAAALGLGGCGLLGPPPEPDCDVSDQRERDADCGYWDTATGRFTFWYWVTPGVDGSPPAGWAPHVPRGGSRVAPPNARTGEPSVQRSPNSAPLATPPPARSTGGGSTAGPAGGGVRVPAPPAPPRGPAPAPRPPAPPRPAGR